MRMSASSGHGENDQGRFRHLPVICQERLVGLVSIGDVVKRRLAECEYEHEAMREYVTTA